MEQKDFMDNIQDYIDALPKVDGRNLKEYDVNLDSGEYAIGGRRKKRFYRASINLFKELVQEITENSDSSYSAVVDDLIREGKYTPKFIPAIIKECNLHDGINEVFASRIYNHFGVSTSYDVAVNKGGNFAILSTDCIKDGQSICSFEDLGLSINYLLEYQIIDIIKTLNKIHSIRQICDRDITVSKEIFDKYVEQYIENYVYEFIVRRYIVGDTDLHSMNQCMLVTDDFRVIHCPVMDKEFSFMTDHSFNELEMLENLQYVKICYPNAYEKLTHKLHSFVSKDIQGRHKYETMLAKEFENVDNLYSNYVLVYLQSSTRSVLKTIAKLNEFDLVKE